MSAQTSTPVGRVAAPEIGGPPYRVFVNGEELVEGKGWWLEGGQIRLATPLRPQPPLGFWRKFTLSLGVGVYGDLRGDTLDITVTLENGETEVSTGHPVVEA
jgi:hypothetical protein